MIMDEQEATIFSAPKCEQRTAQLKKLIEKYSSYGQLILERIEEKHPDKVIWIQAETGREITGREVAKRVRNIACALLDTHNVKPQSIFMIDDRNTIEQCILGQAIIAVGAIPYYVDREEALVELARQARQLEPVYFVATSQYLDKADFIESELGYKLNRILMDKGLSCEDKSSFNHLYNYDYTKSQSNSSIPIPCENMEQDLAALNLSSGTTGTPKPVAISHANLLMDAVEERKYPAKMRFINHTTQECYSARALVSFALLSSHVVTVLIDDMTIPNYLHAIAKYKVSSICLGTVIFCQLMEEFRLNRHKYDLSSVFLLFPFGGKVNFHRELELFCKDNPQVKLVRNLYASSESGRISSRSVPPSEALNDVQNCGQLLPGVKVKIVDPEVYDATGQQKLLGHDQTGLILAKTNSVFTGYMDKFQARVENDIPPCPEPFPKTIRPFRSDGRVFDSEGYYITQDLGFIKSGTNELHVQGRRQELIKSKSHYKVMPHELEEIFHWHPAVYLAVVFGVYDQSKSYEYFRAIIEPHKEIKDLKTREQLRPYLIFDHDVSKNDNCNVEDGFLFKGTNKSSTMDDSLRRDLLANIHRYFASQVNTEKQCSAGVAIIDCIPTMRESGKPNKRYLKSLRNDTVEFYCQDVKLHQ